MRTEHTWHNCAAAGTCPALAWPRLQAGPGLFGVLSAAIVDIVDIIDIVDISGYPPRGWGVSRACPSCTAPTRPRTRTRSQRAQTGTESPGAEPPAVGLRA